MKIFMIPALTVLLISAALLSSCGNRYPLPDESSIRKASFRTGASVHDPSIFEEDGTYYIFGSHMASAVSGDLMKWTQFSEGVSKYNKLFDNLFTDEREAFSFVGRNGQGGYDVWAPDVIYNPVMEKYMMYFCTTSSYIKSNLCFAISDKVEGPYHYQDTILYSGYTGLDIGKTNVESVVGDDIHRYLKFNKYKNTHWPNAIDPALFFDENNRLWMSYGSWSGGIFILEIDPRTGYPIFPEGDEQKGVDPYYGQHLAGGLHTSIEGPYILYDAQADYYYLFVSYGSLTSEGGYQIRLFRSEEPDGPYVDKMGETLNLGKNNRESYGVKLMGNYMLPSLMQAYMAPGHNSAMIDDSGRIFLVHHVRFDDGSERHEPRVRRLFRTADGWLTADPFAYNESEELITDLSMRNLAGYYYFLNHQTDVSSEIHQPSLTLLKGNGKMVDTQGTDLGHWAWDMNSSTLTMTLEGVNYSGVMLRQKDEAGNAVWAISAVSNENQSLWGVHYLTSQ